MNPEYPLVLTKMRVSISEIRSLAKIHRNLNHYWLKLCHLSHMIDNLVRIYKKFISVNKHISWKQNIGLIFSPKDKH